MVQHRELYSVSCNNQNERESHKELNIQIYKIDIYIYIQTESLCCTPETNTTLLINYTSIKKERERERKKKRERAQVNKIRNEKGEARADTTEIQRIMETTMNDSMPIKCTTQKKWTNSQKGTIFQD